MFDYDHKQPLTTNCNVSLCLSGGLVKKILETKKELEGGSQQPGKPAKKTEIVSTQC